METYTSTSVFIYTYHTQNSHTRFYSYFFLGNYRDPWVKVIHIFKLYKLIFSNAGSMLFTMDRSISSHESQPGIVSMMTWTDPPLPPRRRGWTPGVRLPSLPSRVPHTSPRLAPRLSWRSPEVASRGSCLTGTPTSVADHHRSTAYMWGNWGEGLKKAQLNALHITNSWLMSRKSSWETWWGNYGKGWWIGWMGIAQQS